MQNMQQSSKQWWDAIKIDQTRFTSWLMKQYHGEVTAAERIIAFTEKYTHPESRVARTLLTIADQERTHAAWVGELLIARGITPTVLEKEERYWDKTLGGIESFETGAAVAAHAEHMRLERIRVIVADMTAPADVRAVFARILPQEEFHEHAFSILAGEKAMQDTLRDHQAGRMAIGLIPEAMAA